MPIIQMAYVQLQQPPIWDGSFPFALHPQLCWVSRSLGASSVIHRSGRHCDWLMTQKFLDGNHSHLMGFKDLISRFTGFSNKKDSCTFIHFGVSLDHIDGLHHLDWFDSWWLANGSPGYDFIPLFRWEAVYFLSLLEMWACNSIQHCIPSPPFVHCPFYFWQRILMKWCRWIRHNSIRSYDTSFFFCC